MPVIRVVEVIKWIQCTTPEVIVDLNILRPLPVVDHIRIVRLAVEDHVNAAGQTILLGPHLPLRSEGHKVVTVVAPEVHEIAPLGRLLRLLRNKVLRPVQILLNRQVHQRSSTARLLSVLVPCRLDFRRRLAEPLILRIPILAAHHLLNHSIRIKVRKELVEKLRDADISLRLSLHCVDVCRLVEMNILVTLMLIHNSQALPVCGHSIGKVTASLTQTDTELQYPLYL